MEKRIDSIVFRRMTYADFRHINKVGGEEDGGGGQSYIDFPTADVSVDDWFNFLGPNTDSGKAGPVWKFNINSLGLENPIHIKIYQRRKQSVCIASQKIHSRSSNRIPSWHTDNGFPDDYDPNMQHLVIYIAKTKTNEFWAGWFLEDQIPADWVGNKALSRMFTEESAGYLQFKRKIFMETSNARWPFYFSPTEIANDIPSEDDIELELELEDTSERLQTLLNNGRESAFVDRVIRIRKRNKKLVENLKLLYGGRCQITGERFTFLKTNGEFYSEVHHLIPLGEEGSDSYANAIVVSPLIHRMLHYANVSEINLNYIENNTLPIQINGIEYVITWAPQHTVTVAETLAT